jgi:hypothetical protein
METVQRNLQEGLSRVQDEFSRASSDAQKELTVNLSNAETKLKSHASIILLRQSKNDGLLEEIIDLAS